MKYHIDLTFPRRHKLPVERITVEAVTKAEAQLEAEKIARGYGLPPAIKVVVIQAKEEAA